MKLRGVGEVVFQSIRGWSLGQNGGLWCWEFFEEVELGYVVDFRVIGGKCWVGLVMEWRGVLLEV